MAPPSADVDAHTESLTAPTHHSPQAARTIPEIKRSIAGLTQSASFPSPVQYSGTLDTYESFDVTSVIGREFPDLQLTQILNDDAKIKDLAVQGMLDSLNDGGCTNLIRQNTNRCIVSQRGVVFFRNQDIGIEDQKILGQKLES